MTTRKTKMIKDHAKMTVKHDRMTEQNTMDFFFVMAFFFGVGLLCYTIFFDIESSRAS